MNPYFQVLRFHTTFGVPVATTPGLPDNKRLAFRLDLIEDEVRELQVAVDKRDTVEVADALADIIYLCYGMGIECGFPMHEIVDEVHYSNMAKLGPDGKPILRADGKVIKPEGWEPPNIKEILETRGYREASKE